MIGFNMGYYSPCRSYKTPPSSIELLQQGVMSIGIGSIALHDFFHAPGLMSLHEKPSE
jgi:hypothetical protein